MALQASAPSELRGALGRLGYLCAGGGKAMFVVGADPEHAAGPSLSATDHQTANGGTQWNIASPSTVRIARTVSVRFGSLK